MSAHGTSIQAAPGQSPNYLLFVDDSGTKDYSATYNASMTRHFVFGAVLVKQGDHVATVSRIRNLKKRFFGVDEIEVKSNWLRIPKERQRKYEEPFRVTARQVNDFTVGLYDLIRQLPIVLIAAVVDKVHMKDVYGPSPWYPPAVAYDVLLQRVELAVGSADRYQVTMDDMTGTTPKKNRYKDLLERQHEKMRKTGSDLQRGFVFSRLVGRVKFVNSANSDLIQVADVAAYNVLRQFRDHGDEWEKENLDKLPVYKYLADMAAKFRNDGAGRVQGYGIAKFPMLRRNQWKV